MWPPSFMEFQNSEDSTKTSTNRYLDASEDPRMVSWENQYPIIVGEALHLKMPVCDRKLANLVSSPTARTQPPQE
ncbi:hypothetical protein ACTXT7_003726 [Hymenolepis weldensis]